MRIHRDNEKVINDKVDIPKEEVGEVPVFMNLLISLLKGFTTGKWEFQFTWKF